MKKKIQPTLNSVLVICSCDNKFEIKTTIVKTQLNINICNKCHPFYSGKQKIIDTEKRVEYFKNKFSLN